MTKNELIILLLGIILLIFLITTNKKENFEIKIAPITKNEEISIFWQLRGYTVKEVPNFYQIFGSNNLSKYLEFPGKDNWKLFTNTPLNAYEGLASLLRTDSPKTFNDDNKPILTGFIRSTNVIIGIMTPTNNPPSGQWLKSIKWLRVNDVNKNARNVIIWANHKNTTDITLNNNGLLADAIKIHEVEIPNDLSSDLVYNIDINNYKSSNNSPFTTYYFQILDNWGDPYTVQINCLILNYEI
jgi:hypothetical protein